MRLFIAIEFDDGVKDAVKAASDRLRALSDRGTFPKRETFHITLEFLGEVSPERAEDIKSAMDGAAEGPFTLILSGAGAFSGRDGSIWWIGMEPSRGLSALQSGLHRRLEEAGFILEKRSFKPHITIGRRVVSTADGLKEELSKTLGRIPISVREISLMESTLRKEGPIYRKLYGKELL